MIKKIFSFFRTKSEYGVPYGNSIEQHQDIAHLLEKANSACDIITMRRYVRQAMLSHDAMVVCKLHKCRLNAHVEAEPSQEELDYYADAGRI